MANSRILEDLILDEIRGGTKIRRHHAQWLIKLIIKIDLVAFSWGVFCVLVIFAVVGGAMEDARAVSSSLLRVWQQSG